MKTWQVLILLMATAIATVLCIGVLGAGVYAYLSTQPTPQAEIQQLPPVVITVETVRYIEVTPNLPQPTSTPEPVVMNAPALPTETPTSEPSVDIAEIIKLPEAVEVIVNRPYQMSVVVRNIGEKIWDGYLMNVVGTSCNIVQIPYTLPGAEAVVTFDCLAGGQSTFGQFAQISFEIRDQSLMPIQFGTLPVGGMAAPIEQAPIVGIRTVGYAATPIPPEDWYKWFQNNGYLCGPHG